MLKNKKNRYIKTHNLFLSCTIMHLKSHIHEIWFRSFTGYDENG